MTIRLTEENEHLIINIAKVLKMQLVAIDIYKLVELLEDTITAASTKLSINSENEFIDYHRAIRQYVDCIGNDEHLRQIARFFMTIEQYCSFPLNDHLTELRLRTLCEIAKKAVFINKNPTFWSNCLVEVGKGLVKDRHRINTQIDKVSNKISDLNIKMFLSLASKLSNNIVLLNYENKEVIKECIYGFMKVVELRTIKLDKTEVSKCLVDMEYFVEKQLIANHLFDLSSIIVPFVRYKKAGKKIAIEKIEETFV